MSDLRVTEMRENQPYRAVSHSVCPQCWSDYERDAIRVSQIGRWVLLDPAEVALVYALDKKVCFELKDGSRVIHQGATVEQFAKRFQAEMVQVRYGVLVRRELITEARKVALDWYVKLRDREALVPVSRRHWMKLRVMFRPSGQSTRLSAVRGNG